MICVKTAGGEIKRLPDEEARAMVKAGGWDFCPKAEWKKLHARPKAKVTADKTSMESSMSSTSGHQAKGGGKFRKEIPNDRKRDRRMEELGTKSAKPEVKPVSKYAEKHPVDK